MFSDAELHVSERSEWKFFLGEDLEGGGLYRPPEKEKKLCIYVSISLDAFQTQILTGYLLEEFAIVFKRDIFQQFQVRHFPRLPTCTYVVRAIHLT